MASAASTVDQIAANAACPNPTCSITSAARKTSMSPCSRRSSPTGCDTARSRSIHKEIRSRRSPATSAPRSAPVARQPEASRLFANEILQGGAAIGDFLKGPLRCWWTRRLPSSQSWIREGRINPIDPHHLIFAIWATTQHYADFDVQLRAVLDERERSLEAAERTLIALFCDGLRPRLPGSQ